ncbi:MAG: FAD-dependent oxidoreductase, partial [Phycisphaerae bacterium]
ARHGCKVAFIQDRPVLGGNASSEIEVPPMGYIGSPPDKVNVTGLAEELFPGQGWRSFADSRKIEAIVRAEKNISLFLNTRATGVEMAAKDRIRSVLAAGVHSGRRLAFSAPLFIDCTGHGWVGYYAGAECRMGQEARAEFDESLAPVKAGKRTMGNSLYKAVIETRREPVPFKCPDWAHQWASPGDFEPFGSHGRIRDIRRPENFDTPSRGKGRNPGNDVNGAILHAWWVEYGGMLNTVTDAEKIRDELLRISLGLWNYAKNHNPNTVGRNRNRQLVWLNYVPGVRESRRLVGDYIMSQQDFDKQTVHADTIAFTDWGPDVHHPEGFWVRGNDCIHVYQGRRTSIPYRTLYSRNIGNLFMAGRCHSATHIALGGTRVMRPMCMTGQAAGTAAAIARKYGTDPRGVYRHHVKELQQAMLKDGCYLMGVPNSDPDDLALGAKVTASSSMKDMPPEQVNDGWNRVVAKDRSAWAPDPKAPPPHWVQLDLAKPTDVDTVHVTFEARSAACRVEARTDGKWKTVTRIAGSGPRRLVRHFSPVRTGGVRLVIDKPSGPPAICEIRLYHESKKG